MKELEKIVKQLEYFKQEGNCWKWTGRIDRYGYSVVNVHRLMFELFKGQIPKGLVIDHLCSERNCFNPEHLEALTQQEKTLRGNGLDAQNAKKTHCKRGHELSGDNLEKYALTKGHRRCLKCKNQSQSIRRKNATREVKDHRNLVHNQWRWRNNVCKKRDIK